MSETIVEVRDLSKQYRLGNVGTGTLVHDVNRWWHKIMGKDDPYLLVSEANDRSKKSTSEYVWSLKDINFTIEQGDAVGIIGRNGAGKSTLLKILSRITTPTTGSVKMKGRIASLLEVGTGFHPELTGRENVFLNGAILGMKKREIREKFDEIVDFSGVERYIDTPVKRYSSGMYVRLAFAVAAHLESEILIVDEVLAVGDVEFQNKCLGKMGEVSKGEGRTVLFVSHNMGSISQLCSKAVLLSNGQIVKHDQSASVVDFYLRQNVSQEAEYTGLDMEAPISLKHIFLNNDLGQKSTNYTHLQSVNINIEVALKKWVPFSELRVVLRDLNGKAIFTSDLMLNESDAKSGDFFVSMEIPPNFLRPGSFLLTFAIFVPHQYIIQLLEDIIIFSIVDGGSKYAASEGLDYGYIFFEPKWTVFHSKPDIFINNRSITI